ncbi:MAG: GFA family protein [Proteobacteria bacterium]|nr:GFA family protein [Pseudomonadota bacterium]
MTESTYKGSCFCGAVELTVTGKPEVMGYCHCDSCRAWGAAPINGFTLWNPEAVKVIKGQEDIGVYHKTENSHRQFCVKCGGHIMTDHPPMKLVDVYAAVIPDFPFEPAFHVNYGEKVVSMKDGLPKFADMPAEAGGSGKTLPE